MGEEFEGRDLSESVFWGVDLRRAHFRDVDLSGSTFFHVALSDVTIDGVVDRLVVNGVDVTDHVNANDRWYPLRTMLQPSDEAGIRSAWSLIAAEWAALADRAARLDPTLLLESVNGEWSYRDTLRHLVFAIDKWFCWPILGERTFSPLGVSNTGSRDLDWPGVDRDADPDLAEAQAEWARYAARFTEYLAGLDLAALATESEVLENGTEPTLMCFHVVLEETFEHLRYAMRDLEVLASR